MLGMLHEAFTLRFDQTLILAPNSKLRQVPDNQEVWIDKDGFTSIIFDITERVGEPGTGHEIDGKAITTHLEELVGNDVEGLKIWNTAETEFSRLEYAPSLPFAQYLRLMLETVRRRLRTHSSRRKHPTLITAIEHQHPTSPRSS